MRYWVPYLREQASAMKSIWFIILITTTTLVQLCNAPVKMGKPSNGSHCVSEAGGVCNQRREVINSIESLVKLPNLRPPSTSKAFM